MKEALNRIKQTIANKIKNFMLKNNEFKTVSNITEMKDGKGTKGEVIPENLTTNDMIYIKYAPITSVHVKKSFL